jgi:2-desacetyl-2-hydroxyethyl bacteriochlorophyllide A dehydrogenase
MKAAVFGSDRALVLRDVPVKAVGPGDVLVRVEAAGICGTDVHILQGEFPAVPPVVLGHEFAGIVAEIGDGVTNVAVGDRVAIEPHVLCGTCRHCQDGRAYLCPKRRGFGVHLDGGFAEYALVHAPNAYRVPDGVGASIAALAEPLGCAFHGVERGGVGPGDTVAVFGAGPVGIMLGLLARRAGALRVLFVEPNPTRRGLAGRFPFDGVVHPDEARQAAAAVTGGDGFDVVFDASGAPPAIQQALTVAGRGGTLVIFGVAAPDAQITMAPYDIYYRELTIKGSLVNAYAHRRVVSLLSELDLAPLVTHTFPLGEIQQALSLVREGAGLKVQVAP